MITWSFKFLFLTKLSELKTISSDISYRTRLFDPYVFYVHLNVRIRYEQEISSLCSYIFSMGFIFPFFDHLMLAKAIEEQRNTLGKKFTQVSEHLPNCIVNDGTSNFHSANVLQYNNFEDVILRLLPQFFIYRVWHRSNCTLVLL